jgi:hypothetical protein
MYRYTSREGGRSWLGTSFRFYSTKLIKVERNLEFAQLISILELEILLHAFLAHGDRCAAAPHSPHAIMMDGLSARLTSSDAEIIVGIIHMGTCSSGVIHVCLVVTLIGPNLF